MSGPRPNDPSPPSHALSEAETARLLRLAALAPTVPEQTRQAARETTRAAWRGMVAARRRRRSLAVAAATLVALAGLGGWLLRPAPDLRGARVEVVQGEVTADGVALLSGEEVAAGSRIATPAGGRVALRMADGQSMRVDEESRLVLTGGRTLTLEQGGLYIDSLRYTAPAQADRRLEIETPFGVARNLGTKFELRLEQERLRVRVQEGRVEVDHEGGRVEAGVGEQLTVASGTVERGSIDPYGESWRWPLKVVPLFRLEGSTLRQYLDWVGRETGWVLRFDDPLLAGRSGEVILRGSLEGASLESSLDLVLASCGLDYRREGGTVTIVQAQ